jgi:Protein of unknown function (DUF3631)
MRLEDILPRFEGVRRSGQGYTARCPAHDDRKPSLSITLKGGKILINCFAHCPLENILAKVNLQLSDLFVKEDSTRRSGAAVREVERYPYVDERDNLLYEKVRLEPKSFTQRRPDGNGGWINNLKDVRRVLYQLPQVLVAVEVLVVEGEKDANRANELGLVATTSGASGTWREEFSDVLRGKVVTIIADSDAAGRKHAQQVARSVFRKATALKVLELPCAKDLSEWIEHGGTREGLLTLIQNTTPWHPQSADGAAILDKVFGFVRRFVSLSESQGRLAALWILHTHVFLAGDATPYLAITSAEKQSGKTRLLEVLETLVSNPWLTGRVTAAVLIRKIDAERPTLLLDESDAAFGGEKEYAETLRGVLNTGHRAAGKASCCVGKGANTTYRDFSTFCPKAIAGIGKLPDTVADRAIPIRLKRAKQGESIQRFRRRDLETEAANLRGLMGIWATSIEDKLHDARPNLPEKLTDRQQDGAEPLLAIADLAEGDWPLVARQALIELCTDAQVSDDSIGRQLLADIRDVFETQNADRLSSSDLVSALGQIETSPWAEWSHGKPLTAVRLARLLKPFDVAPESIRIGDKTPRGYIAEQFRDSFSRYLRLERSSVLSLNTARSATPQQSAVDADVSTFSKCNTEQRVATPKEQKSSKDAACCVVALSTSSIRTRQRGFEEEL